MGRIFETRKHKMFARYDRMAKQFTRIGKDIAMAVKSSGPDPDNNAALRRCIQNARAVNMPKDRIDAAIKRASDKSLDNFEEVLYEGYAPHGIAILVETATDNTTRTVANVRTHFNKGGGNLGNSGSVSFMFTRMGVFTVTGSGANLEDLELELIDFGLEDIGENEEGKLIIRCAFTEFGNMQKALEERKMEVVSAELDWIPQNTVKVSEEQEEEVIKLIERLEQDDDVQKVYSNMA
ncbi:MAG: YebC/PmpR family DNA-binding transcriptional regulator [Flavobacteriales bacterium]